jgi:hypothetical protein
MWYTIKCEVVAERPNVRRGNAHASEGTADVVYSLCDTWLAGTIHSIVWPCLEGKCESLSIHS